MAAIAAVIAVVVELAEERAFARMIEHANPRWLALAFAFQLLTYVSQGAIWRIIAGRAGLAVSLGASLRLSLTKLFVDQSLPSGGLSGAAVVEGALERRGLSRPIATATMIVDEIGYFAAYAAALTVAIVIASVQGHAGTVLIVPGVLFGVFATVVIVVLLAFAGRPLSDGAAHARFRILRKLLVVLRGADRRVVRNRGNVLAATLLEGAVIVLDAATMWTLIRALGHDAPVIGVYAGYLVASLFRMISITPAGLGAFEAASVIALENTGVPLAVALSATLLFRGLTFWLPMLPGLVVSRAFGRPQLVSITDPRTS